MRGKFTTYFLLFTLFLNAQDSIKPKREYSLQIISYYSVLNTLILKRSYSNNGTQFKNGKPSFNFETKFVFGRNKIKHSIGLFYTQTKYSHSYIDTQLDGSRWGGVIYKYGIDQSINYTCLNIGYGFILRSKLKKHQFFEFNPHFYYPTYQMTYTKNSFSETQYGYSTNNSSIRENIKYEVRYLYIAPRLNLNLGYNYKINSKLDFSLNVNYYFAPNLKPSIFNSDEGYETVINHNHYGDLGTKLYSYIVFQSSVMVGIALKYHFEKG